MALVVIITFSMFVLLGELSPYIQLEDAPDVAATSIMPKLYFFHWISKPFAEHESHLPNESFGDSTFQFVIAFNLLPLVSLCKNVFLKIDNNFFYFTESLHSTSHSSEQVVLEPGLGPQAGDVQLQRTHCRRL